MTTLTRSVKAVPMMSTWTLKEIASSAPKVVQTVPKMVVRLAMINTNSSYMQAILILEIVKKFATVEDTGMNSKKDA